MVSSPELSGGAGFTFEDASVAIYLTALIGEESGPGLSNRVVVRVALQQAAFGEPLDDLIVDAKGADGSECRLSLQVKRALTISSAVSNSDFREIVERAWKTLAKKEFREDCDRVGAITGTLAEASRRALDEVCEWARGSATVDSFIQRFEVPGFAGDERKNVLAVFRELLAGASGADAATATAYRLLRHFVLVKLNVLTAGSTDDTHAIERLRNRLHPQDQARAADLWTGLLTLTRTGAGRAAEFDRVGLLRALSGRFRLAGSVRLGSSLERINDESILALSEIRSEIDGAEIPREAVKAKIEAALVVHRFVQVVGLPGTGKSAALKEFAMSQKAAGTLFVLKSDRLTGANWHSHAQLLGLATEPLDALLAEIGAIGTPILFIDGLDRVPVPQRHIVTDLIGVILNSPSASNWKIVATLRDNGIEPLRTWLPSGLFKDGGVATVEVNAFNEEEASVLAQQKPVLKGLLFGEARVKDIARRAFFADILARALPQTTEVSPPKSETELVDAWWARGGYNSDGSQASIRQRALIKLGASGAQTAHRRMNIEGIDAHALEELKSDGIIRDGRPGHTVVFTHDIFFEWSFLHVLFEHEDDWIGQITAAGEPPVLARPVELMSQATIGDFDQWLAHLAALEVASVRSQWKRAWLIAPFGSVQFRTVEEPFTNAMFDQDARRLAQLAVWFQAERTTPNPRILDREGKESKLSKRDIIRQADSLAWPSDVAGWQRFLGWTMRNVERIPVACIPEILSTFEVWQNMCADHPNRISRDIAILVERWLEDIEDHEHAEDFPRNHGRWTSLIHNERDELEERLRNMLLRTARVERDRISKYLARVTERRRLRNEAFDEIIGWATLLAEYHARELVSLTMATLTRELPEQVAAKKDQWQLMSRSFDPLDDHEMAISAPKGEFSPASPLREPFVSLFEKAPEEALSLVRQLTNHAVTAWRQLHALSYQNRRTPIPLVLNFPWGAQTFWGDQRIYTWPRGLWGPPPVMCGLMSLDKWAFEQAADGRSVDELIQTIVAGHEGCAVLCIAAALIMEDSHVSAVSLPIATSQRIWHWDIARRTNDGSAHPNLIGFWRPADRPHAEAIHAGNGRTSRTNTLRYIGPAFVLNHDEAVREAAQSAITNFPSVLPFDYEDEKQHPARVESLRRSAEIWSDAGNVDLYKAEATPDGKHIRITLESPKASDPDVVATMQGSVLMTEQLTVLNWVHDSFEKASVSDRLTLTAAFDRSYKRHSFRLFRRAHHKDDTVDRDQALVAGSAAVAVLHGGELAPADLKRCAKILFQASATPEFRSQLWSSDAHLMWHPVLYSARGLAGLIRRGFEADKAKRTLLTLGGHPLIEVSAAAINAAYSVWDVDPSFAWIALSLAICVASGQRGLALSPFGYSHSSEADLLDKAVARAAKDLSGSKEVISLPPLPKAWVFAPPLPFGNITAYGPDVTNVWRDPDIFLRWDFLSKVIARLPVPQIMRDRLRRPAFLEFCEQLLVWMLDRLHPSWKNDENAHFHDRHGSNAHELKHIAVQLFARVSLHLDLDESRRLFLDRIFALEDDDAADLLQPFIHQLAITDVLDAPSMSPNTIPLLDLCLTRILADHSWKSARRDRGRLFGNDLHFIIKDLTFTSIEHASLAARFANGVWRELPVVLPLVDRLVRAVGDVPDVTYSFLTLVERSFEHYPGDVFVAQMTAIIEKQPRTPVGWRGTSIAGRIAGLIHGFAERQQPLPAGLARVMLRILDRLVDMGDRRSAALQASEVFKNVRSDAA